VSTTWKRAVNGSCERIGLGENATLSTTSRFGRETCETAIALPPPLDAGAIRSVFAVSAAVAPFAFFAVTTARIAELTSAEVSVYVAPVWPAMFAHVPAVASQRCHWSVNEIGCAPVHVPRLSVRTPPSFVVPVIVGAAVFLGAWPTAVTTWVAREVAWPAPELFVAVTWTRRRLPTSAVVTVYFCDVAPPIGWQFAPPAPQRCHW
jgi:hypothetical protein